MKDKEENFKKESQINKLQLENNQLLEKLQKTEKQLKDLTL